jgi:hypothetical protein
MRVFDTADRQWTKDTTFKREMFSRCNLWILETVHAKTIAKYDALLTARRKAIKSAPRGPPSAATGAAIELNSIRPFSLTSKNTVYLG